MILHSASPDVELMDDAGFFHLAKFLRTPSHRNYIRINKKIKNRKIRVEKEPMLKLKAQGLVLEKDFHRSNYTSLFLFLESYLCEDPLQW
jgi:hypothetical protein